jgi:hypothetical protein
VILAGVHPPRAALGGLAMIRCRRFWEHLAAPCRRAILCRIPPLEGFVGTGRPCGHAGISPTSVLANVPTNPSPKFFKEPKTMR